MITRMCIHITAAPPPPPPHHFSLVSAELGGIERGGGSLPVSPSPTPYLSIFTIFTERVSFLHNYSRTIALPGRSKKRQDMTSPVIISATAKHTATVSHFLYYLLNLLFFSFFFGYNRICWLQLSRLSSWVFWQVFFRMIALASAWFYHLCTYILPRYRIYFICSFRWK